MRYVPPIIAFLALLLVMLLPQQSVQGAANAHRPIAQKPEAPPTRGWPAFVSISR